MTEVVVVTSPACHLCDDALDSLAALGCEFDLSVRAVDIGSAEGESILLRTRAPMPPVVLVDGILFSFGRLPRKKLRRHLERAA